MFRYILAAFILAASILAPAFSTPALSYSHHSYSHHSYGYHSHSYHRHSGYHRSHHSRHHIKRSKAARDAFMRSHPCPANGHTHGACPGYVVDHIVALKRGGPDAPSNMQWQTVEAAKAKDKWE